MEPDDAELLRRHLADPDSDAFARLVTRHIDRVYSVALRQVGGDTHLAQDVAQRVFMDLARKAPSLTDRPTLGGWLYRSTQFAGSEVVRTERRRRAREQDAYAMQDIHGESDPPASVGWHALGPVLDEVMAGLNDRDRDAVAMRFFEDRAFADIGRRLSLSEDAARMRVDRALEKMRTLLARRGVTCTAAALGTTLAASPAHAAPAGLAATAFSTAMAAATGAGSMSTTAVLLALMTNTKFVVGLAAAIIVVAIGIGASVTSAHHTAMAARTGEDGHIIAALTTEVTGLEEQVRQRTQRPPALPSDAPQASSASSTTQVPALDEEALGQKFLADHPVVMEALVRSADAANRFNFAGLFRELALTPEQIDAFLAIQRPWVSNRFIGGLVDGGPNMVLRAGPKPVAQNRNRALEALLGPDGLRRYHEFSASNASRKLAVKAASFLAFDEEPFTPDQIEELTRSIRAHPNRNTTAATSRYAWQEILADVQHLLTPSQLEAVGFLDADDRYRTARKAAQDAWRP